MTFAIQIAKADRALSVDWDTLSADVHGYIIRYGLTQILNDAHSQVTAKTDPDAKVRGDKALALAEKKLAALVAGELRTARGPSTPKDPVRAIAVAKMEAVLKVRFGSKWAKRDKASVAAHIAERLAANPKLMEDARLEYEAAQAAAAEDDGFDIESLMAVDESDADEAAPESDAATE